MIAALLLRHTIENELEDRVLGKEKRISFFLVRSPVDLDTGTYNSRPIQVDKVALVFQQHTVLDCNLGFKIEKFCGDTTRGVWSRAFWSEQFSQNIAIVCTAEILYQCLHHGFIHMTQINLLIFDEAHHAKKNHTYARLMKDFYSPMGHNERKPRVFGMTASPVDGTKEDLRLAMAKLEHTLDSEIATVSDPAILQMTICRPKEEQIATYTRLTNEMDTRLLIELKLLVGTNPVFAKPFKFAKEAFSRLGPWCADRFCQLLFDEEDKISALQARTEAHSYDGNPETLHWVGGVRAAANLTRDWQYGVAKRDDSDLSSKVRRLLQVLSHNFSKATKLPRCIVFVRERNTAELLADLLQQPGINIPNLTAGVLVKSIHIKGANDMKAD